MSGKGWLGRSLREAHSECALTSDPRREKVGKTTVNRAQISGNLPPRSMEGRRRKRRSLRNLGTPRNLATDHLGEEEVSGEKTRLRPKQKESRQRVFSWKYWGDTPQPKGGYI